MSTRAERNRPSLRHACEWLSRSVTSIAREGPSWIAREYERSAAWNRPSAKHMSPIFLRSSTVYARKTGPAADACQAMLSRSMTPSSSGMRSVGEKIEICWRAGLGLSACARAHRARRARWRRTMGSPLSFSRRYGSRTAMTWSSGARTSSSSAVTSTVGDENSLTSQAVPFGVCLRRPGVKARQQAPDGPGPTGGKDEGRTQQTRPDAGLRQRHKTHQEKGALRRAEGDGPPVSTRSRSTQAASAHAETHLVPLVDRHRLEIDPPQLG